MKAFAAGAILAALLAVVAAVILQTTAVRPAHEAFSTTSVRIGEHGTAAARNWVHPLEEE